MKQRLLFFILSVMAGSAAQAQDTVQMADTMRQEGKIYVVVAIILTIFAGIILYLVRLDRKIAKLEKQSSSL